MNFFILVHFKIFVSLYLNLHHLFPFVGCSSELCFCLLSSLCISGCSCSLCLFLWLTALGAGLRNDGLSVISRAPLCSIFIRFRLG